MNSGFVMTRHRNVGLSRSSPERAMTLPIMRESRDAAYVGEVGRLIMSTTHRRDAHPSSSDGPRLHGSVCYKHLRRI